MRSSLRCPRMPVFSFTSVRPATYCCAPRPVIAACFVAMAQKNARLSSKQRVAARQMVSEQSRVTIPMSQFLCIALSRCIAVNALRIALVVGTVLNLVNQGEAIFAGGAISWPHVLLNYLVPYCVASYSAAKNELNRTAVKPECPRH